MVDSTQYLNQKWLSNVDVDAPRLLVGNTALDLVGSPYQHMGQTPEVGFDCATLLIEVFARAGIIRKFRPEFYPEDFWMHSSEERYLRVVEQYAHKVEEPRAPLTGDILLYRWHKVECRHGKCVCGRPISHGAIVVNFPHVVHAWKDDHLVEIVDTGRAPLSQFFCEGVWSVW